MGNGCKEEMPPHTHIQSNSNLFSSTLITVYLQLRFQPQLQSSYKDQKSFITCERAILTLIFCRHDQCKLTVNRAHVEKLTKEHKRILLRIITILTRKQVWKSPRFSEIHRWQHFNNASLVVSKMRRALLYIMAFISVPCSLPISSSWKV